MRSKWQVVALFWLAGCGSSEEPSPTPAGSSGGGGFAAGGNGGATAGGSAGAIAGGNGGSAAGGSAGATAGGKGGSTAGGAGGNAGSAPGGAGGNAGSIAGGGAGATAGASASGAPGSAGNCSLEVGSCPGVEPVPAEKFCETMARAECALYQSCQALAPSLVPACEHVHRQRCALKFGSLPAEVDLAKAGVALACCLQKAQEGSTCVLDEIENDFRYIMDLCPSVFVSKKSLAPGESCENQSECASGFCIPTGTPCEALCVADIGPGEACSEMAGATPCKKGLSCVGGKCVPDACEGDPCGKGFPECAWGLRCRDGADGTRFCAGTPSEGQPCRFLKESICLGGTSCEVQPGSKDGVCQARLPDGAPCSAPWRCGLGSFCKGGGLATGVLGVCTPQIKPGEPCDPESEENTDVYGECGSFLRCQPTSKVCAPDPVEGEPCEPTKDTCLGSWCSGGTCAPLLPPGAACAGNKQCKVGPCKDGVCPPPSCP